MLRSWAQWSAGSAEAADVIVCVGPIGGAVAIDLRSRGAGQRGSVRGWGRHFGSKEWRMEGSSILCNRNISSYSKIPAAITHANSQLTDWGLLGAVVAVSGADG